MGDSIVEEVISMMRTNTRGDEAEKDGPEDDDSSRLEESSSGSSQPPSATNSSSKSPSADNNGEDEGISSTLEPEPSKGKVSRKPSKATHQMSESSDSDIPLSKARQKRRKKAKRQL